MRIAILGPGAVGGFLAAIFSQHGAAVSCIASPHTVGCVMEHGIHLESKMFGEFVAHPQAHPSLDDEPDLLVVTTKAPFLSLALDRIRFHSVQHAIIVPFLNGFEHIAVLRAKFGPRVSVGMISIEVTRQTQCHIIHSSSHVRVELASDTDVSMGELENIRTFFHDCGVETSILEREAHVVWRKLARLNAIALTTASCQMPIGYVRTDPYWRAQLAACAAEAAAVARTEGVPITQHIIMQQIDALPPELSTSLQRDIARGAQSELDAIAGAILRRAGLHDIACPTIELLYHDLGRRTGQIRVAAG